MCHLCTSNINQSIKTNNSSRKGQKYPKTKILYYNTFYYMISSLCFVCYSYSSLCIQECHQSSARVAKFQDSNEALLFSGLSIVAFRLARKEF
jgi:hypothetical protein